MVQMLKKENSDFEKVFKIQNNDIIKLTEEREILGDKILRLKSQVQDLEEDIIAEKQKSKLQ
jgi:hypothetical protein